MLKTLLTKIHNKLCSIKRKINFIIFSRRYKIKVRNSLPTIRYIRKNECSVARFGDGELSMVIKEKNIGFQKYDSALSESLKKVLFTDRDNLLVCLPHTFHHFHGECDRARNYWTYYLTNNKKTISEMLESNGMGKYRFGDTQMTRPYIDYVSDANARKAYKELKRLWDKRNLLIVEGKATKMGIGNDLFDNAASVKRILCPPENAFAVYERIRDTVIEKHSGELVLIALGPTATVLAAELSEHGIWAIDVGHLDVEYEWFKSGAKEKSAIKGKYVNEVPGGSTPDDFGDEVYSNQIIAEVRIVGE